MKIKELLNLMIKRKASDLYFKVGSPPCLRIDGRLTPLEEKKLTPQDTERIAQEIMSERQSQDFNKKREMDLAYEIPDVGRFRVNIFYQRNSVGIVLREVRKKIPSFEELNLPAEVLRKLALETRGLVLITGVAGSGKSTTLAAMIDYINENEKGHIVTIEDPIEFVHQDKKSIISQREVGLDTHSFNEALRHVIRQSPDVILIGEMRDQETMEAAIMAAETGHLVLSTLHTVNAAQAVERIINYFPPYLHGQVRMQLSLILKGVISLRLLPRAKGEGRIPAVEVLVSTPTIKKLILEGKTTQIPAAMEAGGLFGMQTFNQALIRLYTKKLVDYETILSAADSTDELKLSIEGIYSGQKSIKAEEET